MANRDSEKIKVTLVKSVHGQLESIQASVRGLGLRRRHQTVEVAATAENRGMINAAVHLLKVENV
jgi:large subunit ribosomal protein L30